MAVLVWIPVDIAYMLTKPAISSIMRQIEYKMQIYVGRAPGADKRRSLYIMLSMSSPIRLVVPLRIHCTVTAIHRPHLTFTDCPDVAFTYHICDFPTILRKPLANLVVAS